MDVVRLRLRRGARVTVKSRPPGGRRPNVRRAQQNRQARGGCMGVNIWIRCRRFAAMVWLSTECKIVVLQQKTVQKRTFSPVSATTSARNGPKTMPKTHPRLGVNSITADSHKNAANAKKFLPQWKPVRSSKGPVAVLVLGPWCCRQTKKRGCLNRAGSCGKKQKAIEQRRLFEGANVGRNCRSGVVQQISARRTRSLSAGGTMRACVVCAYFARQLLRWRLCLLDTTQTSLRDESCTRT